MSRQNQIEKTLMAMTGPRKPGSTVVFIPSTPKNVNLNRLVHRRNTPIRKSNNIKIPSSNGKKLNALMNNVFRTMKYNQILKQYAINARTEKQRNNNYNRGRIVNNKGKRPPYTKFLINIATLKKTLK